MRGIFIFKGALFLLGPRGPMGPHVALEPMGPMWPLNPWAMGPPMGPAARSYETTGVAHSFWQDTDGS